MRRILLPLITATLPISATAQDRPNLLDFLSIDSLIQRGLQTGIMAIRTQLDLQYSVLSVDIYTGAISLTDIRAWPLPDWDDAGKCQISIDRLTFRGVPLDAVDQLKVTAQMLGTHFPVECLPPEAQEILAVMDMRHVSVPRVTFDLSYGLPKSDATIRMHADIDDVAAADILADFSYLWIDGRDDIEDPLPVMFLNHAAIAVENKGGWAALAPLLPEIFTGPGAGQVVEGMLGQAMLEENRDGAPLSARQTAFVNSVATTWPKFLENPQSLVLETDLSGDVYLDIEALDGDLVAVFDRLRPILRLAPGSRNEMIPAAMVQAALAEDISAVPQADLKRVGLAMLTGQGVPRNIAVGLGLLNPLARGGDGEAAMAMAEAMVSVNIDDAYRWALEAGKQDIAGAVALLDQIEKQLGFAKVLKLQDDVSGNDTLQSEVLTSVGSIRSHAGQRFSGRGVARNYQIAATWAMIAAATGDSEAQAILDDILERARLSGPDGQSAWQEAERAASALAVKGWIVQDLPNRFAK